MLRSITIVRVKMMASVYQRSQEALVVPQSRRILCLQRRWSCILPPLRFSPSSSDVTLGPDLIRASGQNGSGIHVPAHRHTVILAFVHSQACAQSSIDRRSACMPGVYLLQTDVNIVNVGSTLGYPTTWRYVVTGFNPAASCCWFSLP